MVHMYLCLFSSMLCVCVCMLYDDMYLHDNVFREKEAANNLKDKIIIM